MAVDTLLKRYSVLSTLLPWRSTIPIQADGIVRLTDRQILVGIYTGLTVQAPRRNIAIFGLFAIVPRLQITSLQLFTRVVVPLVAVRPVVLFEHGVTLQEKPANTLPAVTQDYVLEPAPIFPIGATPAPIPPPGPPAPPIIPPSVLSYTENWEAEAPGVLLLLVYTENWEIEVATMNLLLKYTEDWQEELLLLLSYTELWEV